MTQSQQIKKLKAEIKELNHALKVSADINRSLVKAMIIISKIKKAGKFSKNSCRKIKYANA